MSTSMSKLRKGPRLRLHFNIEEPVELVELTLAFQGLGFEYQAYLRELNPNVFPKKKTHDVKLYITRIESNCILAELAPALPLLGALGPIVNDINSISEFIRNLSGAIEWLRGASKEETMDADQVPYTKKKLNGIKDIVQMVARNEGSELGLQSLNYEEESGEDRCALEMKFSSDECREASAGAQKALYALDSREVADKEKVLMYFYQTNIDDPKSTGRTGDKAIIQSVHPNPLSVYVLAEVDQQRIRYVLHDKEHNPLHTGFVVDVNIERDPKGKPKLYRVLRVHDVIYDEPDSSAD